MRLWPDSRSTPGWWLRYTLKRCCVGPWLCWKRSVTDWPLFACERHRDDELMRAMRFGRHLFQTDPEFRRKVEEMS